MITNQRFTKNKYGLKLYSHNIGNPELRKIVEKSYEEGVFHYIELYIVPQTFSDFFGKWSSLNVPYIIHAPHFKHGFNLSKESHLDKNLELFEEVRLFASNLKSSYIIVHPGLAGSIKETIRQINLLCDDRLILENMPFIAINGKRCVGGSFDEIKGILNSCKIGFCLDIAHAIKYAFSNDIDCCEYIEKLISFDPKVFHVSDGNIINCFDEHLSFGKGDFPISRIMNTIKSSISSSMITLETPKKNLNSIDDFIVDVEYLKSLEISYAKGKVDMDLFN